VTWAFAGDHRLAVLSVGVYFVIGLILLGGIDVERGRRAAQLSAAEPVTATATAGGAA
ncbi:MAG: MFS transporter, partial [Proteobacteria bacterium]|nr:MFS transporter [Pseudomonadota bacterium]